MRDNRELGSNITDASELQQEKHPSPITSIDESITGMIKPVSAVQANAHLSIPCSFERQSNVTDASGLQ
jgi:hypothetical protein